jgi:hypothetical protein
MSDICLVPCSMIAEGGPCQEVCSWASDSDCKAYNSDGYRCYRRARPGERGLSLRDLADRGITLGMIYVKKEGEL